MCHLRHTRHIVMLFCNEQSLNVNTVKNYNSQGCTASRARAAQRYEQTMHSLTSKRCTTLRANAVQPCVIKKTALLMM